MPVVYWRGIKVTGDTSISRSTCKRGDYARCSTILLLGTTGSGKSSFIEALAGKDQNLGISGGSLESVTKDIQAFKVHNVFSCMAGRLDWDVYVADSPGFSDRKMSEVQIVRKVYQFQRDTFCEIAHAFYFHRITDKRIPGSSRKIIQLLKALRIRPINLTIVTTMWDNIHGEEAMERAESNFLQLRDVTWKDDIDNGTKIVKFQNTHASAIDIISSTRIVGGLADDTFELDSSHRSQWQASPSLFQELLERLDSCRKRKNGLLAEKIQLFTNPHPELESIVISNLEEVQESLLNHSSQLIAFRRIPRGFEDIFPSVVYEHLLDIVVSTQHFAQAIIDTLSGFRSLEQDISHRSKLEATLETAKSDFQLAYATLREFGPPPSGFKPFIPSISMTNISESAQNVTSELDIAELVTSKASDAVEQALTSEVALESADVGCNIDMTTDVEHLLTPPPNVVADIPKPSVPAPKVSIDEVAFDTLQTRAMPLESKAKQGLPKRMKLAFYKALRRIFRRQ
ncbi:hypothetical protein CVT24_010293 [Panaeolus cyanescens]|uniref:G domain-containing protein n=1 Tax=Panaeolus cyanescens TaxID=181874 RepID=A0A409W953_9AGAR|nr:hypothetical protein CVT24_010293 [Panaeolus cyanescens]